MRLMDSFQDEQTTISDMVDGFLSYKFNRYKSKIDVALKKMRG